MASDPDLYERAKALLIQEQTASVSFLQRHLRLGYQAALNLMDELEKGGVVTEISVNGLRELVQHVK